MVFFKKHRLSLIIISVTLIVTGVILLAINNEKVRTKLGLERFLKLSVEAPSNIITEEQPIVSECLNGETLFRSDVLGIKFCYPAKWGTAKTDPIQYLTSLPDAATIVPTSEDNAYSNSIILSFSDNLNINLRFFNEKYNGEYYPNARAYQAGYVDNIPALKESGDICDYNINFDGKWDGKNTLKQIWSECSSGVKTMLIKDDQYFTPMLYVEKLQSLTYKKLQNGYFDNLLLTNVYGSTKQSAIGANSLDDFFSKKPINNYTDLKTLTRDDYLYNKEELADFINKISIYKPIEKKQAEFKTIENENANLTLIRQYFWDLTGQKIEDAFKLIADQKTTLAQFQKDNKDFYSGVPRDFTQISENQVDFYLDYQAQNTKPTVYHKIAKITNGRIAFTLSDEITTEMVKSGALTAYGKRTGNKSYMIIKENNQEVVADEGEAAYTEDNSNIGRVKFYTDPAISPKEKFLTFRILGYEWSYINFYDIKSHKVLVSENGGSNYGMDKDETHAYVCAGGGMSEAVGKVYSLETGKTLLNVYEDKNNEAYSDISCKYDSDQEIILMTLTNETDSKTKMIRYDLETESSEGD